LISNTFTDEDLHFIDPQTRVYVRVKGSVPITNPYSSPIIVIQPQFSSGDLGEEYELTVPISNPINWTSYVDITTSVNAPWTWNKREVQRLKLNVWAKDASNKMDMFIQLGQVNLNVTQRRYLSNISHITAVGEFNQEDGASYGDCKAKFAVKTYGTTYYSDEIPLEIGKNKYNYRWENNPNTSAPWTEEELTDAKFGISLKSNGVYDARCHRFYMIVESEEPVVPEIRTMGFYAEVHLEPKEIECELNKPERTSFDHARNVQALNFWSGDRAVYDLSRSGKSIVLTGKEFDRGCNKECSSKCYQDKCACERLKCIDEMGRRGDEITIEGYSFEPWNKKYRILSFGYKKIQSNPELYEYMLELEEA